MTHLEAIDQRRSRRLYLPTPIDEDRKNRLQAFIDQFNLESGLSIRFVEDGSQAFNGLRKSYGLFGGVRSLLAMIGKRTDTNLKEKVGYYGEKLVLEATRINLGTCWVGGTFDRNSSVVYLAEDEILVCVIPIGNTEELSFKEKLVHSMVASKSKSIDQMLSTDEKSPEWLLRGMRAVQKAPSAVNKQPVQFIFREGKLQAFVSDDGKFSLVDLGIAKAHFEIGAGGTFERGNWGFFVQE